MQTKIAAWTSACLVFLTGSSLGSQTQLLWTVGVDDNDWPVGDGGEAFTTFVQENGLINNLPGNPASPEVDQQADNDYYFAGLYTSVIASVAAAYGNYTPTGLVPANEEAAERAFAAADNDLRYHFNLPSSLTPSDLLSVTFDALNLDEGGGADPRYGIEVYFNGVLVQPQIVIRPGNLDTDYTTPSFTLASVNAQVGPGFDNIVSLKGINYNADGGGNWMGIDYVELNATVAPDEDNDGVPDAEDACPQSDLSPTVVIAGCDSGVANLLLENGCTISDQIARCAGEAANHGAFVSCVAQQLTWLLKQGSITPVQRSRILNCAAQSDLPLLPSFNAAADFSTTQGYQNWFYLDWTGTGYEAMAYGKDWWGDTSWHGNCSLSDCWTECIDSVLYDVGGHPNVCDHAPSRAWESPWNGLVQVTGNAHKLDTGGGDGVDVDIVKNDRVLWSRTVAFNDAIGLDFDLKVEVQKGDRLYFRIHQRITPDYDATYFNPTITFVHAHGH